VGIFAGQIAEAEELESYLIDCALTAGILHDVGKLVLAANLPAQYNLVLKSAMDREVWLPEAERKIFGATHAEVGAYLMGLWGLSDHIVEALVYHHYPAKSLAKAFSPLTAVHIANALAHELYPDGSAELNAAIAADYLADLGLTERLPVWRSICQEEVEKGGK
jgi:HD-like signal output (HDOD) protein